MARTARARRLTAALAAAALLAGCGDDPPERDGAGAITQPGDTRMLNLRAGDCIANLADRLDNPDGSSNGVPKVKAVNCADEHDAEIIHIAPLEGKEWPGFTIVDGEVARVRQQLQPRLARAKQATGSLTLVSFRPTQDRWEFEDQHEVVFILLYGTPRRGAAPA